MKEEEIRPKAIFDEYLRLAEVDVKDYFFKSHYVRIYCPACLSADSEFAFHKKGFTYYLCPSCETLFVNPRPSKEAFDAYYTDSPSVRYWATHFYKETEVSRREKIYKPRAERVINKISEFHPLDKVGWVADIGAGYGVFCEEFAKIVPEKLLIFAIEPSVPLSRVCKQKGLRLVNKFLSDLKPSEFPRTDGRVGVLTSFELIEHLYDPENFLGVCFSLLNKGDLLIFTTLNGKGFDIGILWEKSKSVHPPHHINFFNPRSIQILLERIGFCKIEVTTPGELDVSILENSQPDIKDNFTRKFLNNAKDDAKRDLQEWIKKHKLSSHMMIVAQK